MFTRDSPEVAIDSIHCAELEMERTHPEAPLRLAAKMVYVEKATGVTYGYTSLVHDGSMGDDMSPISKDSLLLLGELVESLEKDLGKLVFKTGHSVSGKTVETDEGLKVGLGGRT